MTKNIVIGVLAVTTLLFGYLAFFAPMAQPLGNATGPQHYSLEAFIGGLQIGQRGSEVKNLLKGTCALIGSDVSQTGTSTKAYDCAVTGVVSGDIVHAQLATSTPFSASRNWAITAAQASSTSGFITVLLTNLGQTAVPSASAVGSSTSYIILR